MPDRPTFILETNAFRQGHAHVAGCDEVGRGAIAGPIVAAAVMLNPDQIPDGIDDSKRLSPNARARLFHQIVATSSVSISIATTARVDTENVLQASLWAMAEAVGSLSSHVDLALVDGPFGLDLNIPSRPIIRGDQISLSIAAASIIAKVTRDRLMIELAQTYPLFGFDQHKGYGTRIHFDRIRLHGTCPEHRYSCAAVLKGAIVAARSRVLNLQSKQAQ